MVQCGSDESCSHLLAASRGNNANLVNPALVALASPQAETGEVVVEMSNSKTRRTSMAAHSFSWDETELVCMPGRQPQHAVEEHRAVLRRPVGRVGNYQAHAVGLRGHGVLSITSQITL